VTMPNTGASVDGIDLSIMLSAGAVSVEREMPTLNQLNVFPVPDADTGTNMLHTVRRASEELEKLHESDERLVGAVASSFARGAFAGARGNSGVILAEILRGFADALDGESMLDGPVLAAAFSRAAEQAYHSVSHPVEGTMLTVIREVARKVSDLDHGDSLTVRAVLDHAVEAALSSVAQTPDLLPILREHGVVDSGALGVAVFLEGMRRGMGDAGPDAGHRFVDSRRLSSTPQQTDPESLRVQTQFGFCTEFLISEVNDAVGEIRNRFEPLGDSLIIAAGDQQIRVHLHTSDPGAALSLAVGLGNVHDISIRNMDDQREEATTEIASIGILAFAPGDGFGSIYESLGAMVRLFDASDPNSIVDVARAAFRSGADSELIVVPNDARIAEAILRMDISDGRTVHVVDAPDPPSGVAALMAYTYGAPTHRNVELMNTAARGVVVVAATGEESIEDLLHTTCPQHDRRFELATVYYGLGVAASAAQEAADRVAAAAGVEDCEPVHGGQTDPPYLISLE